MDQQQRIMTTDNRKQRTENREDASSVAVLRGSRGVVAPGPVLMEAKRGPTPKKKYNYKENPRNCEEQAPRRRFWPRAPQSLKPLHLIIFNLRPCLVNG